MIFFLHSCFACAFRVKSRFTLFISLVSSVSFHIAFLIITSVLFTPPFSCRNRFAMKISPAASKVTLEIYFFQTTGIFFDYLCYSYCVFLLFAYFSRFPHMFHMISNPLKYKFQGILSLVPCLQIVLCSSHYDHSPCSFCFIFTYSLISFTQLSQPVLELLNVKS